MRTSKWMVALAAVGLWGCAQNAAPGDNGPPAPRPMLGGTTGDFGGDCHCDAIDRVLPIAEDDSVLGFSGADILTRIEGAYALPIVWGDNCEPGRDGATCAASPPAFTGSTTEVQLAIESAATEAHVRECNRGGPIPECHITFMRVPVRGTLQTADGLLDEPFAVDLQTETLDDFGIGGRTEVDVLAGGLEDAIDHLAAIEWRFEVSATRARFEVFVITDPANEGRGQSRLVSLPPAGGESPPGHSWGVETDLEDARQ